MNKKTKKALIMQMCDRKFQLYTAVRKRKKEMFDSQVVSKMNVVRETS